MDKSTPKLAEHVCKGKVSKIDAFTIKQNGKDYHRIELENILVSSFQTSGGGSGNDRPMESLSLNFTKIEFKYDLKENKK
jgi:type VI secretion system secreted protein Hcp